MNWREDMGGRIYMVGASGPEYVTPGARRRFVGKLIWAGVAVAAAALMAVIGYIVVTR